MTQTDNQTIGQNVARLREEADISVNEAAQQLGVGRTYWYQIESGTANLTLDKLKRIAQMFGTTVRDLLTERKARREPAGVKR
jgi:transcriptional regulator with XRE-family HTH domain